ncbi:Mobile element protein [Chitinispirillum alkaliphilum]|nr:Mobile element protein [Chitinispirillum alkaliphilum]
MLILKISVLVWVGCDVSSSLGHEGVLRELRSIVWHRQPKKGALFHSDRDIQYAFKDFRDSIELFGFTQSMSRKGNC